jgi:hypothetical protein
MEVTMAQADYVPKPIRALITGASPKPSTNPIRAAHAQCVGALVENPPRPIPVYADAIDLQHRAKHVKGVRPALSIYLTAILDAAAQNVPGGLDLCHVDGVFSGLTSDVAGSIQYAAASMAGRAA